MKVTGMHILEAVAEVLTEDDELLDELLGELDTSNREEKEGIPYEPMSAAGAPVAEDIKEQFRNALREGGKGSLSRKGIPWGEKTSDPYDAPSTRKGKADAKRTTAKKRRQADKKETEDQIDESGGQSRAYQLGYQDGKSGEPETYDIFPSPEESSEYLDGYDDGVRERKGGGSLNEYEEETYYKTVNGVTYRCVRNDEGEDCYPLDSKRRRFEESKD